MNKKVEAIDAEYQYVMLAHHVSEFIKNLPYSGVKGIYVLEDKDLEPMIKRLEVIKTLKKKD